MSFKEILSEKTKETEEIILTYLPKEEGNQKTVFEAMNYSVKVGGKRLRPLLMLETYRMLGGDEEIIRPFMTALEMIHTYSLVHDDLPAMDNDQYRRGMKTTHVVYGEAMAILAGDALLNTAYSILFSECFNGNEYISASKFICDAAGIYGMIGGQSADLLHERDNTVDEDVLYFIYSNKTAKLIIAPIIVPSILNGGKNYSKLKFFGEKLGLLFQFTDDVLDVEGKFEELGKTTGKDEIKYTGVKLYGLEGCKVKSELLCDECLKILESIEGDTQFLTEFVNFIVKRTN